MVRHAFHHPWQLYGFVGLVALAVRAVYLFELSLAPFFDLYIGDGWTYHLWARQIAGGNWLGDQVFYQAPLYPYSLAVVYSVFGESVLVVRLIQLLMGTASCVFLAVAANYFFGARAALFAGLILALYAPSIFLEGLIQKSALALLLATVLLVLLGAITHHSSARKWLWAGIVLGLLVLTRENSVVVVAVMILWLLLGFRKHARRRRLLWGGALVGGLVLMLLPVGTRNFVVGGDFHPTTSQFGSNFYIGNNPESDGSYVPLLFGRGDALLERNDAARLAEQVLDRPLRPAEVSAFWFSRSVQYIRSQPIDWLRLIGRKFALTFNTAEVADTEDMHVYAEWSHVLARLVGVCRFGLLFPAAVFGLVMTGRSWRSLWVLYLFVVAYALSVVMFYVLARYRFPMVLILIPFAAAGVMEAIEALKQRRYRRLLWGVGLAALSAVGANLPIYDTTGDRANAYSNIARMLANRPDQREEAIAFFERALTVQPDYPMTHADLGRLLMILGRPAEAIAHYETALKMHPSFSPAHYRLGNALASQGDFGAAIEHYRLALKWDERNAETHNDLGVALARERQIEEAAVHFDRALKLRPDFDDARKNLERAGKLLETR